MPKRFRVNGDAAFFAHGRAGVAWTDIYLDTSAGKKKRTRFAPLLAGAYDLAGELFLVREFLAKEKDPELAATWKKEISEYEAIFAAFARGESIVVALATDAGDAVYASNRFIDRALAERMIRAYLLAKGYGDVKLSWCRRSPREIIGAVSFGYLAEQAEGL